jgi:hypothetical protein
MMRGSLHGGDDGTRRIRGDGSEAALEDRVARAPSEKGAGDCTAPQPFPGAPAGRRQGRQASASEQQVDAFPY